LLALLCQPCELQSPVKLPADLSVWGIDSGVRHAVSGADYGSVRTAAFMGYRMIAEMAGLRCRETETEGRVLIDDPRWRGYLANLTTEEFERGYAGRLPQTISGDEFLDRYRGITDAVTSAQRGRIYPVYRATAHPIYEHARVGDFRGLLDRFQGIEDAARLGELMYQSHESYSACGLGSDGTDEIVRLVREAGIESGLYGAKITGGGSGGTVAVLGRRGAQAAVETVAGQYAERTDRRALVISGSSPGAGVFGRLKLKKE
jgi:L-arabinokinase